MNTKPRQWVKYLMDTVSEYRRRNTARSCWVTLACAGVEVVTRVDDGTPISVVHGGRLDGQEFTGTVGADAESHHEKVCRYARMSAWKARGRRWLRLRS